MDMILLAGQERQNELTALSLRRRTVEETDKCL